MFDWMTWSIEAMGMVIFLIWIIIPIREFGAIFRRLRERDAAPAAEPGPDEGSGAP